MSDWKFMYVIWKENSCANYVVKPIEGKAQCDLRLNGGILRLDITHNGRGCADVAVVKLRIW